MNHTHKNPLQSMYEQRQDFMIVALTGITGSGCSDFAKLMATSFDAWEKDGKIRPLADIDGLRNSDKKSAVVFAREYRTCYNVCIVHITTNG